MREMHRRDERPYAGSASIGALTGERPYATIIGCRQELTGRDSHDTLPILAGNTSGPRQNGASGALRDVLRRRPGSARRYGILAPFSARA